MREKVNEQGEFCKFSGVTIVANIKSIDGGFWKKIYDDLNNNGLIKSYYSLLPVESSHMTVLNLFCQMEVEHNKWKKLIESHLTTFKQLSAQLNENIFSPVITIEALIVSGVIQLSVGIPEEQTKLIYALAKQFNFEDRIPEFFHVTLAYNYKAFDDKTHKMISQQINSTINVIGASFYLDTPALCHFNDMTSFVPWDAQAYPFDQPAAFNISTSRFFSNNKLVNKSELQKSICCCKFM